MPERSDEYPGGANKKQKDTVRETRKRREKSLYLLGRVGTAHHCDKDIDCILAGLTHPTLLETIIRFAFFASFACFAD